MMNKSCLWGRAVLIAAFGGVSAVAMAGCCCWCWCLGSCFVTEAGLNPEKWYLLTSVVSNYKTGYVQLSKLDVLASDSESDGEAVFDPSRPTSPASPGCAKGRLQLTQPSINDGEDEFVDIGL